MLQVPDNLNLNIHVLMTESERFPGKRRSSWLHNSDANNSNHCCAAKKTYCSLTFKGFCKDFCTAWSPPPSLSKGRDD